MAKKTPTVFALWMKKHALDTYKVAAVLGLSYSGAYQYKIGTRPVPPPVALLMEYIDQHGMPEVALHNGHRRKLAAMLAGIALLALAGPASATTWSLGTSCTLAGTNPATGLVVALSPHPDGSAQLQVFGPDWPHTRTLYLNGKPFQTVGETDGLQVVTLRKQDVQALVDAKPLAIAAAPVPGGPIGLDHVDGFTAGDWRKAMACTGKRT